MGLLDTIALVISLIPGVLFAAGILLAQLHYSHVIQLDGYSNKGYFKWLGANFTKSFAIPAVVFAVVLFFEAANRTAFLPFFHTYGGTVASVAALIAAGVLLVVYARRIRYRNAKKPLVETARIGRLFACMIVVLAALWWALEYTVTGCAGLVVILTPLLAVLCNILMTPIENSVKRWYFNDAKKKLLGRKDLIRIGITGSYGKTSTKFILGAILQQRYHTLVPPSSYNTPMGLTRVIREQLGDEHRAFVAEMGARHVGDIAELCRLVHPQYAVLTSVGPQHLETFGKIENVMKAKYELIEGLPENGVAVFNGDNEYVRRLWAQTNRKKYLYAFSPGKSADVWAENVRSGPDGSRFDVVQKDGSRFACRTPLLGRHNILNVLGGVAIALALGMTKEEIAAGVALVQPVEHRLQIIPTGNGVTVIDDAFNSNPEGSASAIEVIAQFPGRKIVVTPGMVELGEKEDTENYLFGKLMSGTCDFVFLIGPKRTKPIYNGLADGGFPIENIFVSRSLDEATAQMGGILRAGDVVLFENDLPDHYNE